MDIATLRSHWSDVLDHLEREDRMAWIAFFDARLARLDGNVLHLDYSDSRKFSGNLDYGNIRHDHMTALKNAIKKVVHVQLEVVDQP